MPLGTEIGELFVRVRGDVSDLSRSLSDAGAIVGRAASDMQQSLSVVNDAAGLVFDDVADVIERAAVGGKTSMRDMVDGILADLERLAVRKFIIAPLEKLFGNLFDGLFGGARAEGGPVAPGRAFLVGEQGPELFVPQAAGRIAPLTRGGGASVVVHIHASDAQSVMRSETQIAAMLARATQRGMRNL
jgi:phage-related minor tail protein